MTIQAELRQAELQNLLKQHSRKLVKLLTFPLLASSSYFDELSELVSILQQELKRLEISEHRVAVQITSSQYVLLSDPEFIGQTATNADNDYWMYSRSKGVTYKIQRNLFD